MPPRANPDGDLPVHGAAAQAHFATLIPPTDLSYYVTGSPVRALQGFRYSPIKVYRNWAADQMNEVRQAPMNDDADVETLREKLVSDLRQNWFERQGAHISIAHSNKLCDLFLNGCAKHATMPPAVREALLGFGPTPLDKYSLLALREQAYGIVVSDNPSMGMVGDDDTHRYLQGEIRDIMRAVGQPKLYFDYYAFEVFRPRHKAEMAARKAARS